MANKYKDRCKDCICLIGGSGNTWVCEQLGEEIHKIEVCPDMGSAKYRILIYANNKADKDVDKKDFNDADEIKPLLKKYEGFWCEVMDIQTGEIVLDGTFDIDVLDNKNYQEAPMDYKVGDKVVVTELPSTDIYGNKYDETGGGGTIIHINNSRTLIELFDGYIISVENGNYDRY